MGKAKIYNDRYVSYRRNKKAAEVSTRRELEVFKEFYQHMAETELLQVAVFHLKKLHREDPELWQASNTG